MDLQCSNRLCPTCVCSGCQVMDKALEMESSEIPWGTFIGNTAIPGRKEMPQDNGRSVYCKKLVVPGATNEVVREEL